MSILRRAANETVRELGLSVPSVSKVILGIGFSTIVAAFFPVPESESVPDFVPWLIKSIAWLLSVVVVFVLFWALNVHKVARRDRSASAHLEMTAEIAASKDDQMKTFLRNALNDRWYGVARCYAFGSVVAQYPTRDVDIIIQFDSSNERQVCICRDRLRKIESSFEEFYRLKLHVQTFLSTENKALDRFLIKAGVHQSII